MSKVKIVQIALSESEDTSRAEYLDDKGRVWYDGGRVVIDDAHPSTRRWQSEWKQLELPDEPGQQA